ncbi:MAG TPA: HEAT repeat domain-containing protein [Planctomycetota bacterium]
MNLLAYLLLALAQDPDAAAASRLIEELENTGIDRRESAMVALRRYAPDNLEIDRLLGELARKIGGEVPLRAALVLRFRLAARLVLDPEKLISDLESEDPINRLSGVTRLLESGGRGAPLVAPLLKDADQNVCYHALRIVAASNDSRFAPDIRPLIEVTPLRTLAMQCLASMNDRSILPRLRRIVETEPNERAWAVPLLAQFRQMEDLPRLLSVFEHYPGLIPATISAMRRWEEGKRELAPALQRFAAEGISEAILLAADNPRPELAKILRTLCLRDATRAPAAFALAAMGDREAISFLLAEVRTKRHPASIAALGRLKAPEAVRLFRRMTAPGAPPLLPRERADFARAAGEIGGTEAEDFLLNLLEDFHEEVRFEAALGLGRLRTRRAVPFLACALDDAVGFNRISPPESSSPLLDQFEGRPSGTEWSQVREAAIRALASITGESRAGTLDEQAAAWRRWWEVSRPKYAK